MNCIHSSQQLVQPGVCKYLVKDFEPADQKKASYLWALYTQQSTACTTGSVQVFVQSHVQCKATHVQRVFSLACLTYLHITKLYAQCTACELITKRKDYTFGIHFTKSLVI